MGKFINPFTDIGFKRIFGQEFSKPLLLDFLNNLLKGEKVIKNIKFLDKEQPAEYKDDRSLIYDIFCETEDGERIIVEMQNKEQPNFIDRCLYYYSQAITRQGEKGTEWRYRIDAVYLIAFINFKMDGLGEQFRTDVVLYDMQQKTVFTDKERFVFLQLPKFNKEADECENDFERWIFVLKNMEVLDRMPWAAKDSVFRKLAEIAEVSNMSKDDRIKYDSALRHYRDTLSVLQGAKDSGRKEGREVGRREGREVGRKEGREVGRKEGREVGRKEGREVGRKEGREVGRKEGREVGRKEGREVGRKEGREVGRKEVAKKMKSAGIPITQIIEFTGLSAQDIELL